MKLFTLFADLALITTGFATQVANAKQDGKSLADALGADSESIKKSFSDAFSFAAGDLLADAVRDGISAMGEFLGDSIDVAASMESANRRIARVFGEMSGDAHNWAKTTKKQYGISEAAAKTYSSRIGALLSSDTMGLSTEEIYTMSTALTGLAGDLASMYGFSMDVTFEKLLSGLRGETEAIEDLGVDMRAAALAASLGISEDDWGHLDQRTRTLAMYNHIIASTTKAQGNFVETQGTYATEMQLFNSNIQDLQATLGSMLLPAITDLVGWFNTLFGSQEDTSDAMDGMVDSFSSSYATIETTTAKALELVNALSEMEAAGVDTANEQGVWNTLLSELSATLPGIDSLLNTTTGAINGGTEALKNYVLQWRETQREIAVTQAVQGLQNEVTKAQTGLLEAQWALEAAKRTPTQTEALQLGYMNRFREYLVTTGQVSQMESDYMDNAAVDIMLSDMAEAGDVFAGVISGLIDSLTSDEDKLTELQSQEAAAKLEYEQAVAKLNETLTSLEYMQKEDQTQGTDGKKTGTTGKELPAQNITITLNASIDGTALKATLVPEVTSSVLNHIDWRFQTKAVQ